MVNCKILTGVFLKLKHQIHSLRIYQIPLQHYLQSSMSIKKNCKLTFEGVGNSKTKQHRIHIAEIAQKLFCCCFFHCSPKLFLVEESPTILNEDIKQQQNTATSLIILFRL